MTERSHICNSSRNNVESFRSEKLVPIPMCNNRENLRISYNVEFGITLTTHGLHAIIVVIQLGMCIFFKF